MLRQRYQLIPPKDIDDQRILEFHWTRDTPGHTQQGVLVLDATFFDDYLHAKWYCWSKESCNPIGWEMQLATLIINISGKN